MIEAVEMVVRGHLHVSSVSSQSSDKDHSKEILKDALNSRNLLEQWEQIADSIPSKYEQYSIDLLSAIITLWTAVRGHSFAKGWTMNFQNKYTKGVRKSLKTTG